jgi:hypothetical protein
MQHIFTDGWVRVWWKLRVILNGKKPIVRFEVLTAITTKNIFWDVVP